MDMKEQLKVYAVTDSRWLKGRSLKSVVEEAVRGGATMVQIREKEMDTEALTALASEIREVTDRYGVPLLIDDDAEAARRSGAAGVHIGQNDMDPAEARNIIGAEGILGITANTPEEAKKAEADGADYIGAGAVFGTSTKEDADLLGKDELTALCRAVSIPVVAIGGVKASNAADLRGTGIAGAAAVSDIFASDDITGAAARLADSVRAMLGRTGLRAAVFDYDGTIVDSMPMWHSIPSQYVRSLGGEPEPGIDEMIRYMTLEESSAVFRDRYGAKGSDEEIVQQVMDLVEEHYRTDLQCKPGIIDVLEDLKQSGVRMCVATATPSRMIHMANERLGLDQYFERVYSCREWETDKHHPDIYHIAAASLGAAPSETLVFEDIRYASETANRAGFTVIGIADEASAADREAIVKASHLFLDSYALWPGFSALNKARG